MTDSCYSDKIWLHLSLQMVLFYMLAAQNSVQSSWYDNS